MEGFCQLMHKVVKLRNKRNVRHNPSALLTSRRDNLKKESKKRQEQGSGTLTRRRKNLLEAASSDEEDKDEIQILEPVKCNQVHKLGIEQGSGALSRRRKSLFEATSSAKERKDASQISKPDLSTKKCVPCNSIEMRTMTEQAAHELILQVPEWDLVNEGGRLRLSRSWKVKTFLKGLEFFQAVANVAEAEVPPLG
ncbi:hypothetical protein RHMOL_Rhmol12G0046400 [Rhododendron molle]|uniref:Uncharacterized protein n=1 Tax=Rhododendron molle TaxID=49168 RepID=A0ACC0LFX8_RHOML|nr:hypothetical protein RHMOL_Rhmol12G0046400 [Rhododendron molle]